MTISDVSNESGIRPLVFQLNLTGGRQEDKKEMSAESDLAVNDLEFLASKHNRMCDEVWDQKKFVSSESGIRYITFYVNDHKTSRRHEDMRQEMDPI